MLPLRHTRRWQVASLILLLQRRWPRFREATLGVIICFYIGYALYVLLPAAPPRLGANGTATWTLAIPNDPGLTCVQYYQQAIVLDPGINPAGAVISNSANLVMGN